MFHCEPIDWSTFVKRRGTSFQRIVAFEPDPANFEKLEHNVGQWPAAVRDKVKALTKRFPIYQ